MNKPNFDIWADRINSDGLCGQLNGLPKAIEQALEQAWSAGYRYAVKNDWWNEQEKQSCDHNYCADEFGTGCSKCYGDPK